ncbi:MAG: efflux RND transporter periplasmic adaptor subunit [Bacteroidia bacterium]|nr:efflux RND transporter periplasmic adaptor subunit [Bacteroidia bacterium]
MNKGLYIFIPFLFLWLSCQKNTNDKDALLARREELLRELQVVEEKLNKVIQKDSIPLMTLTLATVPIEKKIFQTWIPVQGRVESEENVSVSSEIPGMITAIHVAPGQSVTKGQVLAETDNRALLQQLQDLKTNAELVNQLYQKQKALWEDKIGTEVQFLQAKTQKESMDKKIAALEEQVRMTKIISPINGVVDAVDVKVGQMVSPGIPAIRVINLNKLKIKAELAESYAGKIKDGAPVIIKSGPGSDSVVTKVGYVQKTIHPVSRSFMVEIPVRSDKKYFPNQTVTLKINEYSSESPVIQVPSELILKDEKKGHYLWCVSDGRAVKAPVQPGLSYGGLTEIKNELPPHLHIITELSDKLEENLPVKAR